MWPTVSDCRRLFYHLRNISVAVILSGHGTTLHLASGWPWEGAFFARGQACAPASLGPARDLVAAHVPGVTGSRHRDRDRSVRKGAKSGPGAPWPLAAALLLPSGMGLFGRRGGHQIPVTLGSGLRATTAGAIRRLTSHDFWT